MASKTKKAKTKRSSSITAVIQTTGGKPDAAAVTRRPGTSHQRPRSRQKAIVEALASSDEVVLDNVGDFVNFVREHAIVGLAVGFVVGTQVQAVVKQLIASFIDPLSKLLFGSQLSSQTFTLQWRHRSADFGWGALVYTLIDFVFILAVIFTVIKIFKLDKLDIPKDKKKK